MPRRSMKNCLCSLLLAFFSTLFVVVLGTNAAYSSVGETTDELMRLFFTRWGNGNLTLEDVDNKTGLQVFQLNGSTNEAPSGYNSYHNYTGRYIVISLADVSKSQYNNQISLVVDVNGTGKEYDLVF